MTRSNNSASRTYSRNLTRLLLGLAILSYSPFIIFRHDNALNFRYSATLKDEFPLFVQKTVHSETKVSNENFEANTITKGDIISNDKIMQHYRTPAQILRSPQLPSWVKKYVEWHRQQRHRYLEAIAHNSTPPRDIRFLISRCLTNDRCGGASDRLQAMPYYIMLANQTNRVLLVKWEKPTMLEHYLVPPKGGINWTIPDGMFREAENWHLNGDEKGNNQIVSTIRKTLAAPLFRKYEVEEIGHKIYHEIFRLLFAPSDVLENRLTTTMNELSLVPSMYSSVHLRMKYPVGGIVEQTFSYERHKSKIIQWAKNAVNCAAKLHPNATSFYVTADNNDTIGYLLEESSFAKHYIRAIANNTKPQIKLVARDYSKQVVHIDASSIKEVDAFIEVFEDLMILGLGKCVSHGLGGYGRLGAALSGGVCSIAHRGKNSETCADFVHDAESEPAFGTGR